MMVQASNNLLVLMFLLYQLSDSQRETDDLKSQVEISGGQLQGLQIEVDALKATLHDSKLEVNNNSDLLE